jgi:hypothetical protein
LTNRNRVDWNNSQKEYPASSLHPNTEFNINSLNIINIAKTWKHFHKTWLMSNILKDTLHLVIPYEDLLYDKKREMILTKILDLTKWNVKRLGGWVNIPHGKVSQSPTFDENSRIYYMKQKPCILSKIQIEGITTEVGYDMISRMGYV